MALRVRDSLSGIDSNPRCPHDLWAGGVGARRSRNRSLDAQNVDRLFSRDNRQVPTPATFCVPLTTTFHSTSHIVLCRLTPSLLSASLCPGTHGMLLHLRTVFRCPHTA